MTIERNGLTIEEQNFPAALKTQIHYFTLPGENLGGLVRQVTMTNLATAPIELEVLDGMPALVPYGVDIESLKNMGQTIKAWMQVEQTPDGVPYYRVRASTGDSAVVTEVLGGNFGYAVGDDDRPLSWIADPQLVFDYDTSLQTAVRFKEHGLAGLSARPAMSENMYPCCFFGTQKTLAPGESLTFTELFGQVEQQGLIHDLVVGRAGRAYFAAKAAEATHLTDDLCKVIATTTAHPAFDEYCSYTYMDNCLRGGLPVTLPGNKLFYIYSRKHGDLERDYNYFRMLPEFFSQGNGNFRDVCQNRRMDNFFSPQVGKENIYKFYSLIQLDGYNPLQVEAVTYRLTADQWVAVLQSGSITPACAERLRELAGQKLTGAFTPGRLYQKLQEGLAERTKEEVGDCFAKIMALATEDQNADFGEGYWSDHWTYNLDLVEAYLFLYPERKAELLLTKEYPYFRPTVMILPRSKRYEKTDRGIRQHHFLSPPRPVKGKEKPTVKASLLEKLLLLCATKYAALDAYGMGVEMEGGKPGWYDALNGLPGLFGSSMAETYELARTIRFTREALAACPGKVELTLAVAGLLRAMGAITDECQTAIDAGGELLEFWERRNRYKEQYWLEVYDGISDAKETVTTDRLAELLDKLLKVVEYGINRAGILGGALCPTYFAYEMTEYEEEATGIRPLHFEVVSLPYFLEGVTRFLKLPGEPDAKSRLVAAVKESELYDRKLGMYKVNAPLRAASFELGRARAFTPGWLENESIWLHMEYKYLLAMLKARLYHQYLADFVKVAIPFLDPAVYGRSIYENSSFIASSANQHEALHGKGFVARLSGSTVEFLEMWTLMMFGDELFRVSDEQLSLRFKPCLPQVLVGTGRKVTATLLGSIKVTYHFADHKDYLPGEYTVTEIKLCYPDQRTVTVTRGVLEHDLAGDVRDRLVQAIEVWIR
jgi:hypothetical protein